MLDTSLIKKIEDFVYAKPRSMQEIAVHIKKNWRTAERYVERIERDFGTISSRIFREGTRGALRIVYASQTDKISSTVFQEDLEKELFAGRRKEDFSAFDIFQHISDSKKELLLRTGKDENEIGRLGEFRDLLLENTKKQILFFSGNLSFVNFDDGKVKLFHVLEELVKKGITLKVVSRIDLPGIDNVKKLLSLNHKYGREAIEVHHRSHPLRATIIDKTLMNIKEIILPTGRSGELNKKWFIFYTIRDKEWVEWGSKLFWKMFHGSIGSEKRLRELEKIRK